MSTPSSVGAVGPTLIEKLRSIQNWRTGSRWPDWLEDAVPHIADGGLSLGKLCGDAADALEQRWQPIETAPDREVLLFFPETPRGHYKQSNHAEMRKMGRVQDFPYRQPTHWMDTGVPAPSSKHARSMP